MQKSLTPKQQLEFDKLDLASKRAERDMHEAQMASGKNSPQYVVAERLKDEIVAKMPKTTMQFYETNYNFGSISRGRIVKHTFRFKNTGVNPLMISKTDVTCGCTVTDFPYDPIPPGLDGDLTIEFNSTGKSGYQHNNIIVHSNANPESVSIGTEADVN